MNAMRSIFLFFISSLAYSQGNIVVKDTAGFVRAEESISSQFGSIEFSVVDEFGSPANGSIISITSEETGEILQTISENGYAIFNNLSPGVYIVSTTDQAIIFTTVSILGGSSGLSLLPALGGILGVGGATIGIIELIDSDKKTVMSPSS